MAGPSQRVDVSGSGDGPLEAGSSGSPNGAATEGGGGGSGSGEGRSLKELTAAAEWQLQRAYAELRRAAEAQVKRESFLHDSSKNSCWPSVDLTWRWPTMCGVLLSSG